MLQITNKEFSSIIKSYCSVFEVKSSSSSDFKYRVVKWYCLENNITNTKFIISYTNGSYFIVNI